MHGRGLPFDDGEFDASLAQLVVHFMTDPVAGWGRCAASLVLAAWWGVRLGHPFGR